MITPNQMVLEWGINNMINLLRCDAYLSYTNNFLLSVEICKLFSHNSKPLHAPLSASSMNSVYRQSCQQNAHHPSVALCFIGTSVHSLYCFDLRALPFSVCRIIEQTYAITPYPGRTPKCRTQNLQPKLQNCTNGEIIG